MIGQIDFEVQGDRVSDGVLRYTGRASARFGKKEIKGNAEGRLWG